MYDACSAHTSLSFAYACGSSLTQRDNICYSNSIFQAFYNCEQFKKAVLQYKSAKDVVSTNVQCICFHQT